MSGLVEDYHGHYWRLDHGAHVRPCAASDCITWVEIVRAPDGGYRWEHCHTDDARAVDHGPSWPTWQDAAQDAIESSIAHPTHFGGGID